MANMFRANQAARAIYKPKGLIVYDCHPKGCEEEESSNTKIANYLGRIHAQIFDSLGVSIALAKSTMTRATQKWVHSNNKYGNKRKNSWDEHVVEEYEKEQPHILANQLEGCYILKDSLALLTSLQGQSMRIDHLLVLS
ncbi:hypothetical protein MTR67_001550 [Solanum verrucosum]|uniref:Uncharacterized protein n=1 Tax=Solanum verrucosum TaxID=315347 RepID=A0AAF0PQT1_SOLVR|nr:hypothetical protein MTR67_001550 [Solanum verrucosum]